MKLQIVVYVKTTSGNWIEVFPEINLETIPLEFITDSAIGSGDKVSVYFYDSEGYDSGTFSVSFTSTPQYNIGFCSAWNRGTNFPVSLPTDVEKVWRITRDRNSGIRLLIHCNNVEVLNILMSSNTCSDSSSR